MNLLALRDAVVTGMSSDPRLQGLRVVAHHGEFDKESLARYAKQAPFIAVTLLRAEAEDQGGAISVDCTFAAMVITRNEPEAAAVVAPQPPQKRRDASAISIVDPVIRTLRRAGFWDDLHGISLPDQIVAKNMFTAEVDKQGIAIWAVGWHQRVDLVEADDQLGEFSHLHVDWDLSPRMFPVADGDDPVEDGADTIAEGEELGEVLEAQDDIELE